MQAQVVGAVVAVGTRVATRHHVALEPAAAVQHDGHVRLGVRQPRKEPASLDVGTLLGVARVVAGCGDADAGAVRMGVVVAAMTFTLSLLLVAAIVHVVAGPLPFLTFLAFQG